MSVVTLVNAVHGFVEELIRIRLRRIGCNPVGSSGPCAAAIQPDRVLANPSIREYVRLNLSQPHCGTQRQVRSRGRAEMSFSPQTTLNPPHFFP